MTFSRRITLNCKEAMKELRTFSFYVDCLSDGIGTLLLVFYCVFSGLTFDPNDSFTRVASGAVVGCVVYSLLESFGHLQWAAINPVIAMAFAFTGKISIIKGVAYIIFELVGGIAGAYTAWNVATPMAREQFGSPTLAPDVTWTQGFIVTGIITLSLTLATIASLDDVNRKPTVPALTIGATAAYGIVVASPHSAGISNPAVSFAIAVVTNSWEYQGLFWGGCFSGALIAIILYVFVANYGGKQKKEYATRHEVDKTATVPPHSVHPLSYTNDAYSPYTIQSESLSQRL